MVAKSSDCLSTKYNVESAPESLPPLNPLSITRAALRGTDRNLGGRFQ